MIPDWAVADRLRDLAARISAGQCTVDKPEITITRKPAEVSFMSAMEPPPVSSELTDNAEGATTGGLVDEWNSAVLKLWTILRAFGPVSQEWCGVRQFLEFTQEKVPPAKRKLRRRLAPPTAVSPGDVIELLEARKRSLARRKGEPA